MKPRRTLEELQQIEWAIKQKYGDLAVADPRQFWNADKEEDLKKQLKENETKYLLREENEEKTEKDGFLISKRLLTARKSESCPVCKNYFTETKDSVYLLKFECCQKCYILYVEDREERWNLGWRPVNITRKG